TERFFHPLLACVAVALLCAGCAPMHTPPEAPPPPPPALPPPPTVIYVPMPKQEDIAVQYLLAYQLTLSQMPPAEWPKEAARLGDGSASLEDTMKLALVLGHTHAGGDLQRAQSLLDKVLASTAPEAQAWHGMARLLSTLFAEQRRYEEQIERLQQQLRDTQRDNQRKLDQLNEKLEALKSIERSLNSRIPALPPSPGVPVMPLAPASHPQPKSPARQP